MKKAAYFVYVWPEARSSAAGVRSHELLAWLKADGWEITAISPSRLSPYSTELEKMGISALSCPANTSDQDEFLRALNPSLVVFDRFVMEEQFGWKARELWPNAIQVVDTQDLHSVRRAREALVKRGESWDEILQLPMLEGGQALPPDLIRELSSLYRADAALVVSSWEEKFLRERFAFPDSHLLHLPLVGRAEKSPERLNDRKGFAFLGNFRHAPNLDGINWFIGEIWPAWRKQNPEATLHLYGAYPPEQISHWKGKNGIFAHGPVEDHRSALKKHLALLAPLRFGAGIKGKILEAWSTGTPVIGTPIAFEGMCSSEDKAGLIFTDQDSFVQAASTLHSAGEALVNASLELLKAHYSNEELGKKFLSFIHAKIANAGKPGHVNVIGSLLRHSHSNSSKYFSRWIEAKNKKGETGD